MFDLTIVYLLKLSINGPELKKSSLYFIAFMKCLISETFHETFFLSSVLLQRADHTSVSTNKIKDITIVGTGCRFPGTDNIDEFLRVHLN